MQAAVCFVPVSWPPPTPNNITVHCAIIGKEPLHYIYQTTGQDNDNVIGGCL